LGQNAIGKKTP
jgi:hypothetical protein